MSTDLIKFLQVNHLFFSLNSVRELVDFYTIENPKLQRRKFTPTQRFAFRITLT